MAFVSTRLGHLVLFALRACWVTRRQAPAITRNPELRVILWTNEDVNYDGFLITYERVNHGKISLDG